MSPKLQGKSLMPICYDPEYSIREYIFGERNWYVQRGCGRMVRFGNWVYMRDFTPQSYSFTFFILQTQLLVSLCDYETKAN